jgi:hypothetical protein
MSNQAMHGMDVSFSFHIKVPASWLQGLDAWRDCQPVPSTRAAAIRYLVELGLRYEAACKRQSKEGGS